MSAPYPYTCTACGRSGTRDDGISGIGDDCPDEDCPGTITMDSAIIRASGDAEAPYLLTFAALANSELHATAAEALAFAEWLDSITGGGNDLADDIRMAVPE